MHMPNLRRFTIFQRLAILVGIVIFGLIVLSISGLSNQYKSLKNEQYLKTKNVVETALENNYTSIIIADHGNSEVMINPDGSPNTAHTTNPVPIILVEKNKAIDIDNGVLGDIAPTILDLLKIEQPDAMTQKTLLKY